MFKSGQLAYKKGLVRMELELKGTFTTQSLKARMGNKASREGDVKEWKRPRI